VIVDALNDLGRKLVIELCDGARIDGLEVEDSSVNGTRLSLQIPRGLLLYADFVDQCRHLKSSASSGACAQPSCGRLAAY
jgi:hypothetical protein